MDVIQSVKSEAGPAKRSQAGRPPKYLKPIHDQLKELARRVAEAETKVKFSAVGGKRHEEGLVPPGIFFKDVFCAGISHGILNPFDPTIANMLANNAKTMWDTYRMVVKAATKALNAEE